MEFMFCANYCFITTISTAAVARASLLAHGVAVVCADENEAVRVCDTLAPEHLQLHVRHADALRPRLRNYGALFVGELAAEVSQCKFILV